jgi:hypothetical protein
MFFRPFVYTGVPITHESLCCVEQLGLLGNINEASKALSEREVAQIENLLREPNAGGPSPSHIALTDGFGMKRPYRGGLSVDYPFDGDNILLVSRTSRQGHFSRVQKDNHPLRSALKDPVGPHEKLGELSSHI